MDPNQTVICGNLTRDPELRFTASGLACCSFSVAYNRRVKNAAGEWGDGPPSFFNVTCWREMAENVCESLRKGMKVTVVGRLEEQTWEKDGEKKSKLEVIADDVAVSLARASAIVSRNERVSHTGEEKPRTAPVAFDSDEPFN